MGRGSPHVVAGNKRHGRGVVALGVVAGKEALKFIEHIKTHNTKSRCRNPSIYEPPEFLRSIFSTHSCLQSDNGMSTSNSPPARNMVMIYPDYSLEIYIPKYQNTTEFFFTQIWKTEMLHLQKHLHPLLISSNTPMTIKPKTLFSVFQPSIILNPTLSTLINMNQKTNQRKILRSIKNIKAENQTLSEREITSNSSLSPGELQIPSQVTPW